MNARVIFCGMAFWVIRVPVAYSTFANVAWRAQTKLLK